MLLFENKIKIKRIHVIQVSIHLQKEMFISSSPTANENNIFAFSVIRKVGMTTLGQHAENVSLALN